MLNQLSAVPVSTIHGLSFKYHGITLILKGCLFLWLLRGFKDINSEIMLSSGSVTLNPEIYILHVCGFRFDWVMTQSFLGAESLKVAFCLHELCVTSVIIVAKSLAIDRKAEGRQKTWEQQKIHEKTSNDTAATKTIYDLMLRPTVGQKTQVIFEVSKFSYVIRLQ